MKRVLLGICLYFFLHLALGQVKTIHVFVALCDNENQGIVPVSASLGDGKDPAGNLYWGAAYGIKSYFSYKAEDWEIVRRPKSKDDFILDRLLFKHESDSVYMLAEAYDGVHINLCIENFLKASDNQYSTVLKHNEHQLRFAGDADLLAYIGHNGLMDFDVEVNYLDQDNGDKDVIILACYSKMYFAPEIEQSNANPILWTTHLMAPEAYILKDAIDGWIRNETAEKIIERAAQAYHKYQNCGIEAARNLFSYGF